MQYKVGDQIVHKSHGIGIIVSIEERKFIHESMKFYILKVMDYDVPKKVFIPFKTASERLRPISDVFTVKKALDILSNPLKQFFEHQTWNMRYRQYMEEIHTGDLIKIATVARHLIDIKNNQDMSFGERKLLDQAMRLIENEVDASQSISMKEQLETLLK